MIVQRRPDRLRVFRQADHARACAPIAEALGLHPDVVRAAALHDDGWRAADAAPRWRPDEADAPRAPCIDDFTRWPLDDRPRIWTGCVEAALAHGPYVGALVSRHFERFVREDVGPRAAFATRERERQRALLAGLKRDVDVERDYAYVRALDWISLVACLREPGALAAPRWLTLSVPGFDLTLRWEAPRRLSVDATWLPVAVVLPLVARDLPLEAEASAKSLRQAWEAAPRVDVSVTLEPRARR